MKSRRKCKKFEMIPATPANHSCWGSHSTLKKLPETKFSLKSTLKKLPQPIKSLHFTLKKLPHRLIAHIHTMIATTNK